MSNAQFFDHLLASFLGTVLALGFSAIFRALALPKEEGRGFADSRSPATRDHIQIVAATTEQVDAFNMNPGKWVIYFVEPKTGACAQTLATLENYPVSAPPPPQPTERSET